MGVKKKMWWGKKQKKANQVHGKEEKDGKFKERTCKKKTPRCQILGKNVIGVELEFQR